MQMSRSNYILILLSIILISLPFTHSQLSYHLIGGVTESSFNFKAKGKTNDALALYLNNTLIGTYNVDSDFYYDIKVEGLNSNSYYDISLQINGVAVGNSLNVTTFPFQNQTLDFTFAASSTSRRDSDSFIFDRIASKNPKFFMLLGNMHSKDKSSTDWKDYEEDYIEGKVKFIFFCFFFESFYYFRDFFKI